MNKKKKTERDIKHGISALLVIYNEEKVIERCLKSLYGSVNEIIVIHDGPCTDKTLEIAKKYTKKVYSSDHRGMAELHIIEAISKAEYDWLLRIDADEYLSKNLKSNIKNLTDNDNVDAYGFIWKIWDGKKYITQDFPIKRCLFRREEAYYIEFLHKELKTFGNIEISDYIMEHKPLYNNYSFKIVLKKWKKWAKTEADYYMLEDVNTWNCPKEIKEDFLESLRKRRSLANIFFLPFWFFYSFLTFMISGKYYKTIKTWKVPFFQGIYGLYLCYFIIKNKNNK